MKIGVSTLACDGWTLEHAINVCRDNGIEALEIRMGIHEWSKENQEEKELRAVYEKIREAGMVVSDLATGIVVTEYDEKALLELERCAQIASIWKCEGLRIMLGNFRTTWSELLQTMDYEEIIRWIRAADRIMELHGTKLWIETHNEFATGESLEKLIEDSGCMNCQLIWDIMHPLEAGEMVEQTMSHMKRWLAHVHIKDGKPWEDKNLANYQYTRIGDGTIPIESIIILLRENGYRGYCSLEWEGIWRKELRGEGFEPETAIRDYAIMMRRLLR